MSAGRIHQSSRQKRKKVLKFQPNLEASAEKAFVYGLPAVAVVEQPRVTSAHPPMCTSTVFLLFLRKLHVWGQHNNSNYKFHEKQQKKFFCNFPSTATSRHRETLGSELLTQFFSSATTILTSFSEKNISSADKASACR